VEVGVGSGRFASRLGIEWGVEPAPGIAELARGRGVHVLPGTAESLPLQDASVAALFLITTLCFVRDMDRTFQEVHRVLVPGGHVVVAFIPRESGFGRRYAQGAARDRFFERATLRSHGEVVAALDRAGLRLQRTVQTLTGGPTLRGVELPSDGADSGSFVVLLAAKPGDDARAP
jgi:ubiquinone/menaquinone biosynthesis C-methylase UbiE